MEIIMPHTKQTQPKRLLAIGDIHGHLEKLQRLMDQVEPTPEDRVVFLGDYIDRGPNSKGVIEFLIDFQKRFPQTVFLRGNHEQMLLDAMVEDRLYNGPNCANERKRLRDLSVSFAREANPDDDFGRFIDNGGQRTLDSYVEIIDCLPKREGNISDILKHHEDFLASCGFWHREPEDIQVYGGETKHQEFIFVHAGVCPGTVLEEQDIHYLLWIREPFLSFALGYPGQTVPVPHSNNISAIVVHGHTPDPKAPIFKEHRIGLDADVCNQSWGRIVCCDVLTHEYWEQA
jgi:serine/threonine protein phosphatase 1